MSQEKTNEPLSKTAVISWFLSLQFIFKPSYWLMNYPYSKEVDKIILELLKDNEFTDYCTATKATANLGKAVIWVENRPYASIRLDGTCLEKYRPSRLTVLKALNKLKKLDERESSIESTNYLNCVASIRQKLDLN